MALTFAEVRSIVAPYSGRAGSCASAEGVAKFARTVMQTLLFSGAHGGLKKISILACNGIFSLPPEVEIPVRAKVNGRATEIWGKWLDYRSITEDIGCYPLAENVLAETGSESPLAYPLPPGGSVVGAQAMFEEAAEATILVQGKDTTGHPVFTFHKGEQVSGERIQLKKGELKYGQVVFGEITGIVKPITNGYVVFWAVDPLRDHRQFLADWSPDEQKPNYRRFRLMANSFAPIMRLTLLCRMRLKDHYHDNDLTLFDNHLSLMMTAQRIQAEASNDSVLADYKRKATDENLERESGFKKLSGNPIQIFAPLAGGSIKNIY